MFTRTFQQGRVGVQVALILGCVCAVGCSSKKSPGGQGGAAASSQKDGGPNAASGGSGTAANGGKGAQGGGGNAAPGGGAGGSNAGKGGSNGGAGAAANGGAGGAGQTNTSASVLERNNHPSRDGNFLQPMLTQANAAKLAKDSSFNATFTGNMWASPLYFENGPSGKGIFIAVTTGNDVFALDETTGAQVWNKNIGMPAGQSGAGCGSIKPLGIISTPVIDASTRTLYVAGAIGNSSGIIRHEVHALSLDDGSERSGWPVDVTKVTAGSLQFTPQPENQRSALSLVNGILYVAYGGHVGDCGNYHGWVVGIKTSDPTMIGGWATLGKGEGIWAAGGMASDGTSVFAVTGNSTVSATSRTSSDGEEVVRISGLGSFTRADQNLYYPSTWMTMDAQDADFGASNPLYVSIPGSTPQNYVIAFAKDGQLYMLDSANLGGMDGHKVKFAVSSGSMTVRTAPTAYTSSKGLHLALSIDSGAKCPAPGPSGAAVMGVSIAPVSPPAPTVAWCTSLGSPITAPISTTSDGTADPIVWFVSSGKLMGVDGDSGKMLFASSDTCSGVERWTSPIAVKGRIVVGADNHLCSWSPH